MSEFKRKLERIRPLKKAKQADMEREVLTLARLHREQEEMTQKMRSKQRDYLAGVEMLNTLRQDAERKALQIYEGTVDCVRDQWAKLFREVQVIDKKIQAQQSIVIGAKRKLKAVETLESDYLAQFRKHLNTQEQKGLDEFSNSVTARKQGSNEH